MPSKVSPQNLKDIMRNEKVYALIDVRERSGYEREQIFGATQVPRRLLEFRMQELVPVKDTRVIVYDGDGRLSVPAALTLEKYGYPNVAYLDGGLDAWKKEGNPVVEGVNVPSKTFGELIAARENLPQLPPEELKAWLESNVAVIVIEVRPPEEVRVTGSIPGAINIPGVDLPLSINDFTGQGKKIVVTCAGRTRGIIAFQTLRLMGVKNVYDLKNGTMGWLLAGFELEKGIPPGPPPSAESREAAEDFAAWLIKEQGIQLISVEDLHDLKKKAQQDTLYLFDVRSPEEYQAGHVPGAISLPGGQAIQCADEYVAVRGGNIVFVCDNHARSVITAFWYKQMGFPKVYVLDGGTGAWAGHGQQLETGWTRPLPLGFRAVSDRVKKIDVLTMKRILDQNRDTVIIDVDESKYFSRGHIPGARWMLRDWLELRITGRVSNKQTPVIVTCHNGLSSIFAAATLLDMDYRQVYVLDGGKEAWKSAGLPLESGFKEADGEPEDTFLPPWERGRDEMMRYLTWEVKLISMPEYTGYFKGYV